MSVFDRDDRSDWYDVRQPTRYHSASMSLKVGISRSMRVNWFCLESLIKDLLALAGNIDQHRPLNCLVWHGHRPLSGRDIAPLTAPSS
jgi:hypothetical protein